MQPIRTLAVRRTDPVLATLRAWLALGALALLLVPAARGMHPLIGWLPFWFAGAPAASIAALRMLREPGWPFGVVRGWFAARGARVQARRW